MHTGPGFTTHCGVALTLMQLQASEKRTRTHGAQAKLVRLLVCACVCTCQGVLLLKRDKGARDRKNCRKMTATEDRSVSVLLSLYHITLCLAQGSHGIMIQIKWLKG